MITVAQENVSFSPLRVARKVVEVIKWISREGLEFIFQHWEIVARKVGTEDFFRGERRPGRGTVTV